MIAPRPYSQARAYRFLRLCVLGLAVVVFAPFVIAYVLTNAGGAR